jgi:tripartite-type tricarboxylate transporter receptor subunit TctC
MAPAKTPKEVVAKLHDDVQKALKTSEVQNRMTAVGGEVSPGTQQDAAALIHSERLRYDKLVRDAHIKPD